MKASWNGYQRGSSPGRRRRAAAAKARFIRRKASSTRASANSAIPSSMRESAARLGQEFRCHFTSAIGETGQPGLLLIDPVAIEFRQVLQRGLSSGGIRQLGQGIHAKFDAGNVARDQARDECRRQPAGTDEMAKAVFRIDFGRNRDIVPNRPLDDIAVVQIGDSSVDVVAFSTGEVDTRHDGRRALDFDLALKRHRPIFEFFFRGRAAIYQEQRNREHLPVAGLIADLSFADLTRQFETIGVGKPDRGTLSQGHVTSHFALLALPAHRLSPAVLVRFLAAVVAPAARNAQCLGSGFDKQAQAHRGRHIARSRRATIRGLVIVGTALFGGVHLFLRVARFAAWRCVDRHKKSGQIPARRRIGQNLLDKHRVTMARPDQIEPQFRREPFADLGAGCHASHLA